MAHSGHEAICSALLPALPTLPHQPENYANADEHKHQADTADQVPLPTRESRAAQHSGNHRRLGLRIRVFIDLEVVSTTCIAAGQENAAGQCKLAVDVGVDVVVRLSLDQRVIDAGAVDRDPALYIRV